jgi:citrate lyase beta subunit
MRDAKQFLDRARSALFVPGSRPERFIKARTSGADVTILDLEDSVLESEKSQALKNIVASFESSPEASLGAVVVRVNSPRMQEEVSAILESSAVADENFLGFVIPKVESWDSIPALPDHLFSIAIIESIAGIRNADEIARHPKIAKLAFGGMDFAAEVETNSPTVHDYARVRLLLASVSAGIGKPWDSPSAHIKDLGAVKIESEHAHDLGFGGKMSIHPSQIEVIHSVFRVKQEEIDWAREVLASKAGAAQVSGQMVDRPVLLQAQRILKRAGLDH